MARDATSETLKANTGNTITDPDTLIHAIENVRKNGYSLDDEEFMVGMIAAAVPILDGNGRMVATLSFHAPTIRFSIEKALEFLPALRSAAADLASLLND